MRPDTLQRLEALIESAAAEQVVDHQAQMARAWDELQRSITNGADYHRGYGHGRREERDAWIRRLRSAQAGFSKNTPSWQLLQKLQEASDG